MIGTVVKVSN